MSVYDNMAFGLKLRKLPRPEIDRRVREAAALLGLGDYLGRKPKTLSGGQRQRVALGRAIVRQPKVFLFDEPLSNLDAKMRVQMRAEIAKLHARLRTTMIYVTHDQVEAMTMGDRICVMKDGRIMQIAEPLELYNRPANLFVAGFIGSPPMNFLKGTLRSAAGGVMEFVEDNTAGAPASIELGTELARKAQGHLGRPVVFGLRPEDMAAATAASPPRQVIEFNVGLAEPLGPETYLYLTTGAHNLVARMPAGFAHFVNRTLRLSLAVDRAHLFDPQTEVALT
jgi:multiple sugar transport system ATP-binding protein